MKNIFRIFRADFRRLSTNVVAVVIVMGLCIIPSLYAWFNILSNWDPYGPESTSNLKIAVYSCDEGTTVEGVELNIGSNVVSGLESNSTMGWVFSDTQDEALNGVYSGDYYAAMIIPENFSADMISFMNGDIEHPQITYYENEKKNAIAPKITSKAKTAVQNQVNSSFITTIAETVMKISNSVTTAEDQTTDGSIVTVVTNRLTELSNDLQSYINILDSFISVTNSASSLIATTQVVIPDLNNMVESGENTVNTMQGAVSSGTSSAQAVADMVSYSFSMIDSSLSSTSTAIQTSIADLQAYQGGSGTGSAKAALEQARAIMPYVEQMFDSAVSGWEDNEAVSGQITDIKAQMQQLETDLDAVAENTDAGTEALITLGNQITAEMSTCQSTMKALEDNFNNSVKPQLNSTMNAMQNSLTSAQAILYGVDGDFSDVNDVLNDYATTLKNGSAGLQESRNEAVQMKDGLDDIIVDLTDLTTNEDYSQIMDILRTDPQMLGDFVSSPVNLDTEEVYAVATYGSAMAPFYTILALWVGALILVAIIHVHVHPVDDVVDVKPYQQYFGRYIVFFLIGQIQTLITVLGDLFYIKIQCYNPFLFWLAAAASSFVFTLFIYSLTVAFGNIGEAIAIIVMVIQVAGAGGTFPIETLPKVYQYVYKYLPFPYGMNAMRETIGGMYGMEYWKCIGSLGIYIVISLFIGLVVAIPFRKLMKLIEKSKENTSLMI